MTNGALCSSHLDEIPAERCQLANTITLCEPNTKHQLYIPSNINNWPGTLLMSLVNQIFI
jgi:hypothetical protein